MEKCLPGPPAAWHCAGPTVLAQPTGHRIILHLAPVGEACARGARARSTRHSTCLPVLLLIAWKPRATPRAARHLSPSLQWPPLLSLALPRERLSAAFAAACCSRSHRAPLASLLCPEAPPPRPQPLHQATRADAPCSGSPDLFFNLGPPEIPFAARSLRRFPEPNEPPIRLPVSSAIFFPAPRACTLPLAASSTGAEPLRRTGSSPAKPR